MYQGLYSNVVHLTVSYKSLFIHYFDMQDELMYTRGYIYPMTLGENLEKTSDMETKINVLFTWMELASIPVGRIPKTSGPPIYHCLPLLVH